MADIITRLRLDNSNWDRGLAQATRSVNTFKQTCLTMNGQINGIAKSMASMATAYMGPMAAFTALTGAINNNIQTAKEFEQSVHNLSSLTGMTGDALEDLKKKAIELGGSTTQTASQVAESFMLIGSKMPELLKDAKALQSVTKAAITLAEASGGDVTTSANALTAALNIMGEGAYAAERYINTMAATSQLGTRNIQELTDVLFRAGQNARATGISFEELMAIAGAGTKEFSSAEFAGQGLSKLFIQLEKNASENMKPSVVGLAEAIKNLAAANYSTVEATKMFTKNGAAAYFSIIHNKDAILELLPKIQNTNTATEQAANNTDTLKGSLNKLASAWEEFNLKLNDSNGFLKSVVDSITSMLTGVNNLGDAMPEFTSYFTNFGTVLTGLLNGPAAGFTYALSKWGVDIAKLEQRLANFKRQFAKDNGQQGQDAINSGAGIGRLGRAVNKNGVVTMEEDAWDDSTEEGIRKHIEALKELRSTADIAGQEYANLTAEITRLQNILKGVKDTNTVEEKITGLNIGAAKGLQGFGTMMSESEYRNLSSYWQNQRSVAKNAFDRSYADKQLQNLEIDYKLTKLTPTEEAMKDLNGMIEQWLSQEGGIEIDVKVDKSAASLAEIKSVSDGMAQSFNAAAGALNGFASESKSAAAAAKAFTIAGAIAQLVAQFAEVPKGKNIWTWIAGTIAGVGTLAAAISSIHKSAGYAEGGEIKGASYMGDAGSMTVGVNAGEYVLNRTQMGSLAAQLSGNSGSAESTPYLDCEKIYLGLTAWGKRTGRGELMFANR